MTTKHNGIGPKRIFKAYFCSVQGLKAAFQHEAAFSEKLLTTASMAELMSSASVYFQQLNSEETAL
ncbi:MAG: hypothetical protein D3908_12165 [Candidatus Electrothrix sp. AUS4]|nr:hypothetical protein [Candidatus Electrothrix sp. AUS4]